MLILASRHQGKTLTREAGGPHNLEWAVYLAGREVGRNARLWGHTVLSVPAGRWCVSWSRCLITGRMCVSFHLTYFLLWKNTPDKFYHFSHFVGLPFLSSYPCESALFRASVHSPCCTATTTICARISHRPQQRQPLTQDKATSLPPPSPGRPLVFCLCGRAGSGCFRWMESCHVWPPVPGFSQHDDSRVTRVLHVSGLHALLWPDGVPMSP